MTGRSIAHVRGMCGERGGVVGLRGPNDRRRWAEGARGGFPELTGMRVTSTPGPAPPHAGLDSLATRGPQAGPHFGKFSGPGDRAPGFPHSAPHAPPTGLAGADSGTGRNRGGEGGGPGGAGMRAGAGGPGDQRHGGGGAKEATTGKRTGARGNRTGRARRTRGRESGVWRGPGRAPPPDAPAPREPVRLRGAGGQNRSEWSRGDHRPRRMINSWISMNSWAFWRY